MRADLVEQEPQLYHSKMKTRKHKSKYVSLGLVKKSETYSDFFPTNQEAMRRSHTHPKKLELWEIASQLWEIASQLELWPDSQFKDVISGDILPRLTRSSSGKI